MGASCCRLRAASTSGATSVSTMHVFTSCRLRRYPANAAERESEDETEFSDDNNGSETNDEGDEGEMEEQDNENNNHYDGDEDGGKVEVEPEKNTNEGGDGDGDTMENEDKDDGEVSRGSDVEGEVSTNAVGEKDEVNAQDLLQLVKNRGPDGYLECTAELFNWSLWFCGSVLWMQGKEPVMQPVQDNEGNVLLWNGDIFDGPMVPSQDESDTAVVFKKVFQNRSTEEILNILSTIKGPYSFVYWDAQTLKLWFGRDRIGRHSLLYYLSEKEFILTSVGEKRISFLEVPVCGIFMMDFSEGSYSVTIFPWSDASFDSEVNFNIQYPFLVAQTSISSPVVMKCPPPYEPSEEYAETIKNLFGDTHIMFDSLCYNSIIASSVDDILKCLTRAVKMRTEIQRKMCRQCLATTTSCESLKAENYLSCTHPQVGILFSGGLDSTIVAALAHLCIPSDIAIDLFNVAFEKGNKAENRDSFNVPDRITGIQSYNELKKLYPNRQWNFIQINVLKTELNEFRKTRISDLIHPLESVLDDSLGCALWFASKLNGFLNEIEYTSPVRILLLGMGADEQFGGYTRHRTILRHQGWEALANEMTMEVERIAVRNLGRDDRIVADHGCQARFPFLDEDVMNCISSVPVWARCYPTTQLPPGVGDKILLRLVAWKLGLKKAAFIPKRAFQFGSRIANSKEKATDVSSRLKS